MLARLVTCAVVDPDIARGMIAIKTAGLPDAAVQEAQERVRAAVRNMSPILPKRQPHLWCS
jgi:predicted ATPase with chaperone activity